MPKVKTETATGQESVVYLSLSFTRMGAWRKADTANIQVEADKKRVGATKDILASKALQAIHLRDAALKRTIETMSLPAAFFKDGVYAVPVANVERVEGQLLVYSEERNGTLLDRLKDEYPERVDEARRVLGPLFNEADYPPVQSLGERFGMKWRWVSVEVAPTLSNVSEALFQAEREKAAKEWREALEAWRILLREEMRGLCAKLASKMGPDETFKDSTVTNVSRWLDEFSARNVANDRELKEMVEQARLILRGVKPQDLRENDNARGAVREAFTLLRDNIEVGKKGRKFSFGEEA